MRHAYICPYCDQRSTRWWNLKVHIKRRHGGFLLGRLSDSNPLSPNNPYHNIRSLTVADSVGDSLLSRYIPQQGPVGITQYYPSRPPPTMEDQTHGHGLSRVLKIEELKRLMSKHFQYHENPDGVIKLAIYNSIQGDDTLLNNKLEQLRTIDRRLNGWAV